MWRSGVDAVSITLVSWVRKLRCSVVGGVPSFLGSIWARTVSPADRDVLREARFCLEGRRGFQAGVTSVPRELGGQSMGRAVTRGAQGQGFPPSLGRLPRTETPWLSQMPTSGASAVF